jgi:polysaccharide chain length determinant protein (PEP-CTERM system associated)
MLPGKKYGPEDFLRIAWRRRWWVIVPTAIVATATVLWVQHLPNRYRSQTTILVVPPRVPQDFVKPTVTTQLEDRLQMISQQILSRTRLERIVQEFNLYQAERQTMIMEDVIEQMRQHDIHINIASGRRTRQRNNATAFTVSFESPQARTAMQVTDRLASLFVQESLQDRELLADATSQFMQAQLDDARKRLVEHEKKLEAFRERNAGRLPSQLQSNLQVLQTTQLQLQSLAESSQHDRDRLAVLETAITEALDTRPPVPAAVPVNGEPQAGTAAQQLETAKAALRNMELRLKPEHPDIGRAKRMIAELQAKADAEALEQPLARDGAPSGAGLPVTVQQRVASMRMEADQIRRRLDSGKVEEARLKSVIESYSARLDAVPGLEAELTELMRDYSTLQETYTTLLKKSEESKVAVNLERRQIGEQFRIIDGARLPERPISPNRLRLNTIGTVAGLALGLLLAGLLEYRDTSFKTDEDVVTSLALPVLAVIPSMITALERARRRRRRLIGVAASMMASVVVVTAAAWKLGLLSSLVR